MVKFWVNFAGVLFDRCARGRFIPGGGPFFTAVDAYPSITGKDRGIGQRFHKVACKFAVAFWFAGVAKADTCGFDECRLAPRCRLRKRPFAC